MPQISPQTSSAFRTQRTLASRDALLAADIGGTHARIGLVLAEETAGGSHSLTTLAYRLYRCADYPTLEAILGEFQRETGVEPAAACIACAGYVLGDTLINANLPWSVSISAVTRSLGIDKVRVVNDFQALAYAAHFATLSDSIHVAGDATLDPQHIRLAVGAGTGLGAAALIPGIPRPTILATEAGHAALAPRTALESEILRHLRGDGAHVSNERVLSGPGLLNLYHALCAIRGIKPVFDQPVQITQAALGASDALAIETIEVFCAWLGSFVGDLIMLLGAFGGVILAGGVLPQFASLLQHSAFAARLSDKGALRDALARVPVRLIEHGQLGVTGAARWYFDHELNEELSTGEKKRV